MKNNKKKSMLIRLLYSLDNIHCLYQRNMIYIYVKHKVNKWKNSTLMQSKDTMTFLIFKVLKT